MGIRERYSTTVTVSRLVTTGNKQSFSTVATIKAHKQPLNAEYKELFEGDWTKSYMLYTDVDENIKMGDKLTIESETYYVKAFKKWDVGNLTHLELIIEEKNA